MQKIDTIILGAGMAGLCAGYNLSHRGQKISIFEKDNSWGGLAKTIDFNGFKFDLGGHRFWTKNKDIESFVKKLINQDLLAVDRHSKIFIHDKLINYPLELKDVLFSFGIKKNIHLTASFMSSKMTRLSKNRGNNFEDWIVKRFGQEIYHFYFRPYTEKVWGIKCNQISSDWANQRIKNVSLASVIRNILPQKTGAKSFINKFYYPKHGIGMISDKLVQGIKTVNNEIYCSNAVVKIKHNHKYINEIKTSRDNYSYSAKQVISSIPLTQLLNLLDPTPPRDILDLSANLKFRSLILIALVLDKQSFSKNQWIYFPDPNISFGRLHEPKNWSQSMGQTNKTLIVLEVFCDFQDSVWQKNDEEIKEIVAKDLINNTKLINNHDIENYQVIRIKYAYPVYQVGYQDSLDKSKKYLFNFQNLQLIDRGGLFMYNNIDQAMAMGFAAANNILQNNVKCFEAIERAGQHNEYLE